MRTRAMTSVKEFEQRLVSLIHLPKIGEREK